jgi:hypothetical protein
LRVSTIPSHKGNANQNHIKIPPHFTSRTQTANVGEDVRKKELSFTAGGNVG